MFSEPRASKTPFDRTETIETYARRVSIAETRARVAIARVRSDARIPSRAREVTPGERTAPAGSPRPIPARRATPESTRVRSNSTFSSNRPRVRRRHASARASESAARAFEKRPARAGLSTRPTARAPHRDARRSELARPARVRVTRMESRVTARASALCVARASRERATPTRQNRAAARPTRAREMRAVLASVRARARA